MTGLIELSCIRPATGSVNGVIHLYIFMYIQPSWSSYNMIFERVMIYSLYTSTPQLPLKRPQIPSNRDHRALNGGTFGGVGILPTSGIE